MRLAREARPKSREERLVEGELAPLQKAGLLGLGFALAFDNVPVLHALSGLTTASPAVFVLVTLLFVSRKSGRSEAMIISAGAGLVVWTAFSVLGAFAINPRLLSDDFLGEPTIFKGLRTLIIVGLWLGAIVVGIRLALWRRAALFYIGVGLLVTNLAGEALQLTGLLSSGATDWLHAVNWFDHRPRAFKFESSALGASLIAGFALVAIGRPRAGYLPLLLPFIGLAVWASTSRGALTALGVGLALALVGLLFVRSSGRLLARVWGSLLAVLFAALAFFSLFFTTSQVWSKFAVAGSDATRSGWGLVAIDAASVPPLGLNVVTYWKSVPEILSSRLSELTSLFAVSDLRELTSLASGASDSGLTPKTVPALFAGWFGWPGLALALILLTATIMLSHRIVGPGRLPILVGVYATILSLVLYVPGIFIYETALVVGGAVALGLHEHVSRSQQAARKRRVQSE